MGDDGSTWQQEFDNACTMDRTTRLYGFAGCFALGWLLSGLSLFFITQPTVFAAYYSVGNVVGIGSTFFLFGPCSQLKRMFDPVRIVATLVYLAAIGLTLFVAFKVCNAARCVNFSVSDISYCCMCAVAVSDFGVDLHDVSVLRYGLVFGELYSIWPSMPQIMRRVAVYCLARLNKNFYLGRNQSG